MKREPRASWQHPSLLVIGVAGAITLFFAVAIVREFFQSRLVGQQLHRLRQDVVQEEKRQKELQELLTYLSSPTFQERQARLELGLKGTGEKVVIVPGDATTTQPGAAKQNSSSTANPEETNPDRWWRYFFHSNNNVQ